MDILKSSNIERIMYDMFGATRTKELMQDLNVNNKFEMTSEETAKLQSEFSATFSDDSYGMKTIKSYLENGYLMDPHTATCIKAYENLMEKDLKNVIYSTAEWTKFSPTVLNALHEDDKKYTDKEALEAITKEYNAKVPSQVDALFDSEVLHKTQIDIEDLEKEILNFI
jgi:threonine synthase